MTTEPSPASLLRRGLIGLAAFTALGLAAELAIERHWGSFTQFVPWVSIGAIILSAVLLWVRPTRTTLVLVLVLALAIAGTAGWGVYLHVGENLTAGALDADYASTWETMSFPGRLWAAAAKSVGPAPTLAPGSLVVAALLLALATVRHPGRGNATR